MQQSSSSKKSVPYLNPTIVLVTPTCGFAATLLCDVQTFYDDGRQRIIVQGTKIAVVEFPAHYVTDQDGITSLRPAGDRSATPDGKLWVEIHPHEYRIDA